VAWLNELVYLFDAGGLLFHRFEVLELEETRLRARCHGEQADPSRHRLRTGVKAATYHQLEVRRAGGGWRVRVFLDI
jgi:SHS2 domain-containing protein